MSQFSWKNTGSNLKTGLINKLHPVYSQRCPCSDKILYMCHPHQRGWSNLIQVHCKKEKKKNNRGSVSEDWGHTILFMIVHYKKAHAMASTNVCLFIKLSNNPQNRFELLSGNQNLSSQK